MEVLASYIQEIKQPTLNQHIPYWYTHTEISRINPSKSMRDNPYLPTYGVNHTDPHVRDTGHSEV